MFDRFAIDFVNICRDELCEEDHIHAEHGPIRRRRRGSFDVNVKHRELVREAILGAVDGRVLRPFSVIYQAVLDDYGSISERRVYRVLSSLVDNRAIAAVVPSGSAARLRAGGFVRAGYVRYDSPLLYSPSGFADLVGQANDMHEEFVAAITAGRHATA